MLERVAEVTHRTVTSRVNVVMCEAYGCYLSQLVQLRYLFLTVKFIHSNELKR